MHYVHCFIAEWNTFNVKSLYWSLLASLILHIAKYCCMDISDMSIQVISSLGPLGKSKIIKTSSGALIVSREGQLLIDAYANQSLDTLSRALLKMMTDSSLQFGDGVLSLTTIISRLLEDRNDRLDRNSIGRKYHVEILRSVILSSQESIKLHMITHGFWSLRG